MLYSMLLFEDKKKQKQQQNKKHHNRDTFAYKLNLFSGPSSQVVMDVASAHHAQKSHQKLLILSGEETDTGTTMQTDQNLLCFSNLRRN